MIVFDLKLALLVLLLLLAGTLYLAALLLRQRRASLPPWLGGDSADLRPILDTAPFGLLLLDGKPAVVYANRYARRLISADWQAELFQDAARLQQSQEEPPSYYRVLNLPSEQAVSWWMCALPAWTLVLLADLSQQRRLERAAQVFLSSLSHELRTPLTAILAHIEVMRTPGLPPEARQNSLNLIHKETNRIARLVQNLLELNRLETTAELNPRPIDLLLIIEEAIADVILEAEARQIAITLQADTALTRVLADPDKIKQVILNLLDNAVKYGRAGDRIEVSAQKRPSGIGITICDTGPGITAAHLPHVAERLYRGRTDVEGSGLGLAIAAEILRRHGSRLEIESQSQGQATGTAVRFVLPTA